MARVHKVIADVAPHDSVERYTDLGVEVVKGYGKLIDPWTVEIKLNDGGTQTLNSSYYCYCNWRTPICTATTWY